MIKLTSLISEIYISGFSCTEEKSKFNPPENFDQYSRGAGWYAYRGCNDWETAPTAACIYFEGIHDKHRIWMNINYPPHLRVGDSLCEGNPMYDQIKRWGDRASQNWLREARKFHRIPKEYSQIDGRPVYRSWSECFQAAVATPAMKKYVKEWGIDGTTWRAYRPSQG